uniref:Uncharacterized protein n=1 Tax=Roseihalotalea indica TaxID=2867963 RepID=A0AA49GU44_9BACT|nr:hypothetical protein K4G66_10390 [Tunicatimonas sp. TK19036]
MAQRDTNTTGKQAKGEPSGTAPQQDKASIKNVGEVDLEQEEELRDEYTDGQGNPDPAKAPVKNPNRNTDKTKIDQPAYGNES